MALFNRIVVILLLLSLIPVITIGLIVPRETVQVLLDGLDDLHSQLDTSVSTAELVIRIVLALVIDSVLVVLLYLQVRRRPGFGVPVQQAQEGEAEIAVDSITDRLVYHLDPLPGVLNVGPKITPHRGGVEVTLDVEMAVDVDMPANIDEISTVTRQVIEDELGLKLRGKPKLNLRTVLFPEPTRGIAIQRPARVGEDEPVSEPEPTTVEGQETPPSPTGVEADSEETNESRQADDID